MKEPFSRYQIFVVALVAFLNFTVILDFMILSPLGAILLEKLHISTEQFGHVVSAYAFSAGISGLLSAGFADRFDRKKLLLFFYVGFLAGTLFCALARSYELLLAARIFTGIFGGVMGSIGLAIVTDLFTPSQRGRVMGFVQTAFSASQILGLPLGLYLATKFSWHAPFLMIVGVGLFAGVAIAVGLKPVADHIKAGPRLNPFAHLARTAIRPEYVIGFSATILLATGGFMLMPFGTTYLVHNIHIGMDRLFIIYLVTGISSMIFGPLLGQAADSVGKYRVFAAGSVLTLVMVVYYTRLGPSPLWWVIVLNVVLFAGITARMVSSFAMTSALPEATDRGAYMAIANSLQQLAGGVAAFVAGLIVHQDETTGALEHYPTLGILVGVTTVITMGLMFRVDVLVKRLAGERAAA